MDLPNKKNIIIIAYMAANDALSLSLLVAFGSIIAEGLIPGFVSVHLPLAYVGILVIMLAALVQILGHELDISYEISKKRHAVILPVLLTFSFLIMGNSMLKYPLWQNLLITLGILSASYILFTLFIFPVEDKK